MNQIPTKTKIQTKSHKIIILILLGISLFLLFWNLFKQPISTWDEGTNAEVVYETLNSENPLSLRLFDQPFFEKPPLWYYLTEISVRVLGYNELGIRLISALSGLGLMLTVFLIGKKLFSFEAGMVSWLVLLGTRHLFQIGQEGFLSTHTLWSADADSLQLFLIMASFYSFWKFTKRREIKFLNIGAVLSGLAFLAKGPFALLPGILLFLFAVINSRKRFLNLKQILTGTLFFLITVLPWFTYQIILSGGLFLDNFLTYHIIGRVVSTLENHGGSIFTYIVQLWNPALFFSLPILVLSLVIGFRKKKLFRDFKLFGIYFGFLLSLIIITLIQTKLTWYLFYVYPFAALIIGFLYSEFIKLKKETLLRHIITYGILSIGLVQIATNVYLTSKVQTTPFNYIESFTYLTEDLPNRSEIFYLRKNATSYVLTTPNKVILPIEEFGCSNSANTCMNEPIIEPIEDNGLTNTSFLVERKNLGTGKFGINIEPLEGHKYFYIAKEESLF